MPPVSEGEVLVSQLGATLGQAGVAASVGPPVRVQIQVAGRICNDEPDVQIRTEAQSFLHVVLCAHMRRLKVSREGVAMQCLTTGRVAHQQDLLQLRELLLVVSEVQQKLIDDREAGDRGTRVDVGMTASHPTAPRLGGVPPDVPLDGLVDLVVPLEDDQEDPVEWVLSLGLDDFLPGAEVVDGVADRAVE
eukprot:CAMPEP_0115600590 /NCGR_PEP_ID=MMETSP0272-20121206/14969_1 /TAXON_ID=71861 /ORGANISM="Scrippsiella trochoidea, Strain CCMP3099" /LENGTH=190 /DNA_ID=CAMNT_0003036043 /DNA_START=248 /DNA_END=817 /DNA_ORIENTATION=+